MDVNWEFQQENARLRKEISVLRKEVACYRMEGIPDVFPSNGKTFSEGQREFIKVNNLDYQKVYRLTKKYGSAELAIIEVVGDQNEFNNVI